MPSARASISHARRLLPRSAAAGRFAGLSSRSSRELVASVGGRVQAARARLVPADLPMPVLPARQITPPLGPVSGAKIFPFCSRANQFIHALSHPARGADRDRHETRGGMPVDAEAMTDEAGMTRTAKSCGSDVAVLASSCAEVSAQRRWQESRSPRARYKP
jgi:hypothetical protein